MGWTEVLLGGLLAFAATTAGAALILLVKKVSEKQYSAIIAFSAGVMGYAAVEMLNQSHALLGDIGAIAGLALGLSCFAVLERLLPHIHRMANQKEMERGKKKAALLAGTITLHNIPEGFAIGSAFATSTPLGWLVAVSIAIQDFPEGTIVAAPLSAFGMKSSSSFFWGAFSGFVEFAAAIVGFAFLSVVMAATPFALAFSAGAMSFVTLFELIPDSFAKGERNTTAAIFVAGVALAFALSWLMALN